MAKDLILPRKKEGHKNEITTCQYIGGKCPVTNLNGSSCIKKQRNGTCLKC